MEKLKNKKLQIGGIVLLLVVLPIILLLIKSVQDIRQRASGGTISLSSTIPSGSRTIGESFFSDVVFDTQGNNVTAFDITLTYDKSILNATGVVATTPFTLVTGQTSTPGTVHFTAISKTPVSGTVTVGKISFQALKAGSSTNSYSNIQIAAFGNGSTNITSNQASSTVTVGSGATATPTTVATSCTGGIANCANSDGSNYSCSGTKIYNDNTSQNTWCKNNGGAGSREYCWKCIGATITATLTPTPTPTSLCPGGINNCANDSGSNYSCSGSKVYVGNQQYDNWCRLNGGAGSREYCWKCISATATPTPAGCPGGINNCANDSGSNYSCSNSKIYIGNDNYDSWCKNNGGAGSREYCWKCQ